MHPVARAVAVIAVLACAACDKVPITDVNAGFVLADVSWFEQEQTMFLFYQVNAEARSGKIVSRTIPPHAQAQMEVVIATSSFFTGRYEAVEP